MKNLVKERQKKGKGKKKEGGGKKKRMKKKKEGEIVCEGERGEYGGQQINRKTLPMSSQTEKSTSSRLVWREQEVSV